MAKEVDLKKVELKVSVNCCDGCKRKVKKLLQGTEGVLKTEIDSSQPKVTVTGNVDPKILVKKLIRVGKQAEVLRITGNQKPESKDGEATCVSKKDKVKDGDDGGKKSHCDEGKFSNSGSGNPEKTKDIKVEYGDTGSKKDQKECESKQPEVRKNVNQEVKCIEPGMVHETGNVDKSNVTTYTQYCYIVEPSPRIPLPYYAVGPHVASPIPPPIYYARDHYVYESAMPQAPVARVGDYFSDENTVGCTVM